MTTEAIPATPLVARTVATTYDGPLLDLLPPDQPVVSWVRRGEGLLGWGVAAVLHASGASRFADASAWWSQQSRAAIVRDEVALPGSGLVAFGSFGFAASPGDSVLVVPSVVVGRRGEVTWVTTIGRASIETTPTIAAASAPEPPAGVVFGDGALPGPVWESRVAAAIARIAVGQVEKVVLARDLLATAAEPIDVRWPLRRLAAAYESCWTFHVEGLFGATPELLIRRERGLVTSRVLAGTIQRTGDDKHDLALAAALARSSKDLEEHEYAVRSVADALAPHTSSINVPDVPYVLHLPNVMHLATDIAGVTRDEVSVLDLAASLHPSAAVGGTPTPAALTLISELEGMDRGRYAGPVGWIDATGDGELGIALRCAQLSGSTARLFAGAGVVADSDPEAELAETSAKLVPVRDSLGD